MENILNLINSIPIENIIITIGVVIFIVLLYGFALYRAARKESKGWFWILLIFPTLGILPLIYLIFSKKPLEQT